jgi:hypothetical protein
MTPTHAAGASLQPAKCILRGETPSGPGDHVCELPASQTQLISPDLMLVAAGIGLVFAVLVGVVRRHRSVALAVAAAPVVVVAAIAIFAVLMGPEGLYILIYAVPLTFIYVTVVAIAWVVFVPKPGGRRE